MGTRKFTTEVTEGTEKSKKVKVKNIKDGERS
jgi:hypothetical protein